MSDLSAKLAVDAALAQIARLNGDLRALIHVDAARARAQVDDLDRTQATQGPLFGATFVAKDLIDVARQPTQAGSKLFGNRLAAQDAACVARLRAAGAVVLGKANMHELAAGGAVNPWFGQVINPQSVAHGTGGTSSGSAAAVAAAMCSFALGTDTGGSNRSVAAACGVYGYKPSHGLISLDGVLPTARSMDTVGIIAPSAEMISQCLRAMMDEAAATTTRPLHGRTFARITNLISSPMNAVVSEAVEFAFASISAEGGRVITFEIDAPEDLARAGIAILRYEFAQIYGDRIDRSAENVGAAVHSFLAASRQISANQYTDATALAAEHRAQWAMMLAEVDGFITPTAPGLAPDLATETTAVGRNRVPYGAAGAEFRMWANTIGIPAVAIPVPRAAGLPASVQLSGAKNSDRLLLDLAAALGRAITQKSAASSSTSTTTGT